MNKTTKLDMPGNTTPTAGCHSAACACHPQGAALGRRDFLKLGGLAATGLAFSKLPAR